MHKLDLNSFDRLPKNLFNLNKIKYRNTIKIKKIIIHCSDFQQPHSIYDINDWHLKRGWAGCGYHYFINFNGHIAIGRRPKWIGSHCRGQNSKTLGICLAGKTQFTQLQAQSLVALIASLISEYPTIKSIKGHRSYSLVKTCPNISMKTFLATGTLVYAKKG